MATSRCKRFKVATGSCHCIVLKQQTHRPFQIFTDSANEPHVQRRRVPRVRTMCRAQWSTMCRTRDQLCVHLSCVEIWRCRGFQRPGRSLKPLWKISTNWNTHFDFLFSLRSPSGPQEASVVNQRLIRRKSNATETICDTFFQNES